MIKPKVFCYFTEINDCLPDFSRQSKELISLWRESWSDHGWNPVVLDKSDAAKHPLYTNQLWNPDSNLVRNSLPAGVPSYIKACYERWFAYATAAQAEDFIHWADYDVINYGYTAFDLISDPCRFDNCFCSGVLNTKKANQILDLIVKYAFVGHATFDALNLKYNNDAWLLCNFSVLPIVRICSDPTVRHKQVINWKDYKLTHFHGGIRHTVAKRSTRLEAIAQLRPYEKN